MRLVLKGTLKLFVLLFGGILIAALQLYFDQGRFVFLNPRYSEEDLRNIPPDVTDLSYLTSEGQQYAYFVRPKGSSTPMRRLWMVFVGQGGPALGFLPFAKSFNDLEAGFLLFDYPGYGQNEGRGSSETVLEASNAAFEALAHHLNVEAKNLENHTGLIGESLGTGAALEFAVDKQIRRVLLFMPYTSIKDVSCYRMPIVCNLISGQFDARKAMLSLQNSPTPPDVVILNSTVDNVVPSEMATELARDFTIVKHHFVLEGAGHAFWPLFSAYEKTLYEFMTAD